MIDSKAQKSARRFPAAPIAIAFVLGVGLTLAGYALTGAQGKGNVVAVVNGQPVTKEQFYDRLEIEAGDRVLDQLIAEILVSQAQKTRNITVTEQEIDAELEALKASYPSEEAFEADLALYDLTLDALREEINLNLVVQKLSRQGVSVSDEEVRQYFEEHKAELDQPEEILVRHILVATEDEAKAVAAQLEQGADFGKLAGEKSTDPGSANREGLIGYIRRDDPIVEEFKDAAFSLDAGETSGPVKSEFGWHIIRVDERREAREATLENSRERIAELLMAQKARSIGEVLDELRSDSRIEIRWPRYEAFAQSPDQSGANRGSR